MKLFTEEVSIAEQRELDRIAIAAQTAAFLAKGNSITEAKIGESGIDDSNSEGMHKGAHALKMGRLRG